MEALELNGLQKKTLREAIAKIFDPDDFNQLLETYLDAHLYEAANSNAKFPIQVGQAIEWAMVRGKLDQLIDGIKTDRPNRSDIDALLVKLKFARPTSAPVNTDLGRSAIQESSTSGALQRLTKSGEGIDRLGPLVERFFALLGQVCRIEADGRFGTGFLVGDDLVLTNFHLVQHLLPPGPNPPKLICRFDYLSENHAGMQVGPASRDWCLAHAPYAPGDAEEGGRIPTPGELDYALLRLERRVGNTTVEASGKPRGIIALQAATALPQANRILFIAQHPDAAPLSSSWGLSNGSASGGLRLRYTAETLAGSSGSPVFDADFSLVALHHAGEPGSDLRPGDYNQGIPIPLIMADLVAKGVDKFWG